MVATAQIARKLSHRRQKRRFLHKMVKDASRMVEDVMQSVPDTQAVVQPTLTPAEIMAQWEADDVIGSWANREDIQDSAEYARQLRWKAEHRNWG